MHSAILRVLKVISKQQCSDSSSGLRINMAKDDAAGLAVGMLQDAQARGFAVAQRTLGDGISALQVADGGLRTMDGHRTADA